MRYKTQKQPSQIDCGAACLSSVLEFYGNIQSNHQLRSIMGTSTSGTSLYGLARSARKLGLEAKALEADTHGLGTLELPCILHWENKHWVVLWKIQLKRGQKPHFLIGDPADGKNKWFIQPELETHWTGKLLWLQPSARFERGRFVGKRGVSGLLAHLSHFRGSWAVLLEVGLASVVLTLLGLAAPLLSQILFDRVLTFREDQLLPYLLVGILLMSAFQTAFSSVRGYVSSHLAMRLDYRLHLGYLDHLLRLPLRQHETRLVGDLLQRFSDLSSVRTVLSDLVVTLPASALSLVVSTALLILYNPQLALVASLNIPLQLAYLFILSPRLRENSRKTLKKSGELQSFLIGSLEGLSTLKAWRAEGWALSRGRDQVSGLMDVGWQGLMLHTWGGVVFGLLGMLGSLITLWFGATQVLKLDLSVGQLVAANGLMANALAALTGITTSFTNVQEGVVASDRLAEVLEIETEQEGKGVRELPSLRSGLTVQNLSFGYLPELPILKRINLEIPRGSYTALLGSNGSGKSTLATILTKMLEPDDGRVLWDGISLSDVDAGAIRDRVLYLRQDVPLFYASMRENLGLGVDLEDTKLWVVLGAVGLEKMARRLPEGLDTIIGGESLYKLSSGERQMLGLARALLSSAEVLILDEPTATLDLEREQRVVALLSQLKGTKTLLVVTHRPALIEPADRVLKLENGEVVLIETKVESKFILETVA
jgi:ABC-type bacteriocin/lantibiotic exporter with double-glycine peptidase domain